MRLDERAIKIEQNGTNGFGENLNHKDTIKS